jgi:alpha-tubulin suppressor-like RCC1 family protein
VRVRGLPPVVGLSAGNFHYHAHERNGTLWAWGVNNGGELGIGVIVDNGPAKVANIDHVATYSAGAGHSLAIAHQNE